MNKLLVVLIFVLAGTNVFALPIKVGDDTIDIYASIRASVAFNHTDKGEIETRDRSQFIMRLQSNSRVGVRWTRGDLFLHNELGMGGDAAAPSPTLRLLYGDYRFAGGEKGRIRVGQIPGVAITGSYYNRKLNLDNGLQGFGTMKESRRVGINYEIGGFSVAAISMRQDSATVTGLYTSDYGFSNVEFSEIMPRIEASYSISSFNVAGTYVKSSVMVNNTVTGEDNRRYHVDAGHLMVAANPMITNNTRLIASGFYSVNGGLYQMVSIGGGFNPYDAVRSDLWAVPQLKEAGKPDMHNTSVFGGVVALNVSNRLEAGFGIQSASSGAWEEKQTGIGVYANYTYIISNFRITPEIVYMHSGDRARTSGAPKDTKGLQAGVQFRFDI